MTITEFAEHYKISLSKLRKRLKALGLLRKDNNPMKVANCIMEDEENYNVDRLLYVLLNDVYAPAVDFDTVAFMDREQQHKQLTTTLRKIIGPARKKKGIVWMRVPFNPAFLDGTSDNFPE